MKFMMIFEGVDRATKVMNKIMAAEKKAAASVKAGAKVAEAATNGAAKASQKQASVLSKIGSAARGAFNAVVSGAKASGRAIIALHRQTVALGKAGISQIGAGSTKALRGLTLAAGVATAAVGASALAANQLIGVASQFEKFQTILETTEGSSAKAKEAMAWVADFAAKTPYELDEVMDSFVKLRSYGLDPTNGLLKSLGDTSAAMGKPVVQAVEAVADAVTGENERLKEFGIIASKTGKTITYEYTNAAGKMERATVKASDRAGIQAKLMDIFNKKYGGAMAKLSATWDGMTSNLTDIWSQFQLAIMNAGLFDWMKGKLQGVLDTVNQMKEDGTLDAWAQRISDRIVFVLETAWQFATRAYEIFAKLGGYLQMAADYVGGWENLGVVLAGMVFAPILISTAAGIVQIALGLSMLSAALMANPIVLLIAAIVAGAVAIYMNWEPIKAFFLDLWNSIAGAAEAAWNTITSAVSGAVAAIPGIVTAAWDIVKGVLMFSPAGLIISNWGGISAAVSSAIGTAFSVVNGVWSQITGLFDWSPIEAIKAAWAGIADAVGGFIDDAAARAGAAWSKVKSVFSFGGDAAASASVTVTDPATIQAAAAATAALKADMQAVAAVDTGPAMAKLTALEAAAQRVGTTVMGVVRQAQSFLANVSFYDQGAALMDTMAAGMRARAAVVIQEIQAMTQTIRNHLPSSPAKVGPLSDIHRLKFGETIARSIRAEPMVKAMRSAAAATMTAAAIGAPAMASASTLPNVHAVRAQVASLQSAGASGGGTVIQFSPNLTLSGNISGNPADIKAAVQDALRASARELADLLDEENRRRGRREF